MEKDERANMGRLYQALKEYAESDYYGFHMPGHKRKMAMFSDLYFIDITEIEGFDDLHHAEGILLEAEKRAAALYGAEETHFLVNGSTAGILSAISGCCSYGDCILAARNCHKSVYHGIFLNHLEAEYVYPQKIETYGINGGISPEDVDKCLKKNRRIRAVILTSPTYDGVASDLKEICRLVHGYGIPLIVDAAHGAHFPFHLEFPMDAVAAGADVVIHSLHKTLPALTQTALIHVNGNLVSRERIRKYLSIYQTSSPSYVLMASIDSCIYWLQENGKQEFERYVIRLKKAREQLKGLKKIRLVAEEAAGRYGVCGYDPTKLVFSVEGLKLTGRELYEKLWKEYHLQMEMATDSYVLGISTVADEEADLRRLCHALEEIDAETEFSEAGSTKGNTCEAAAESGLAVPRAKVRLTAWEAEKKSWEWRRLTESAGKISAFQIYIYPPGIPLLVPGEEISGDVLQCIRRYLEAGLEVHGLSGEHEIAVITEEKQAD